MKRYFCLILIILTFNFFILTCNDSKSEADEKTITITQFGWVIENIDISFWETPPSNSIHAFYDFFIYYDGDISAIDIKSARIYVPSQGYYWTLQPDKMLNIEKKMIGGWFRFNSYNPNVLPIDQFKAEIILNNGNVSTLYKTIPAPGNTSTANYYYVYTPEEVSSYYQGTPLIKRATLGSSEIISSTQTVSINFSVNDSNVYNGYVFFYDSNDLYIGYSIKQFRDNSSTSLTSIINSLNIDGNINTITMGNSDIKYLNTATFNQIYKYIVILTDGSQYADQGRYSTYDCRSLSVKTQFTTFN